MRYKVSMGVQNLPSFAQVHPPSDFLPSGMAYTYLCDYQDSYQCLNTPTAIRQLASNAAPLSGMGVYIKKGDETSHSLFLGVATLAQANAYPTDPTKWAASYEILPSSYTTNEVGWDGFFFDSSIHYIQGTELYLMAYSTCNGCDIIFTNNGWFIGLTPTATCAKAERYDNNTWTQLSNGMTSARMGPIGLQCGDYHDPLTCAANGCNWYCNLCNSGIPGDCETMLSCNQTDCETYGCHWWNGSCHKNIATICSEYNNPADCVRYDCHWYGNACYPTPGVTCWKCTGETAESKEFPPGSTCGAGDAATYPNKTAPNCITSCKNPNRAEGKLACINGQEYQCVAGVWGVTGQPCLSDCAVQGTESDCKIAGCSWYAYPNPFGTPSCQDRPMIEAFMPYVVLGGGAVAFLLSLIPSGKSQQYYPQPTYYPQAQAQPQRVSIQVGPKQYRKKKSKKKETK
jgi:hypothetical protein